MNLSTHRRLSIACSIVLFCAFLSLPAMGQYKEWKPISPEEISAKTPVVEKDADAEALFWEQRIDDSASDELDMWHYVRVKVFTERGREKYSKFDIPYSKDTKVKNLAARVIKTDGTIVDVAEKDIFDREIVKAGGVKIKAKSFAVPNIEPGVIVEYKYKESIDDAGASGMRLQLQRDLPVQRLIYYYKPYNGDPMYQVYNTDNVSFNKDTKGYWMAQRTNVPAFRDEPRMPPEDTVRPWLLLTSTRLNITSVSAGGLSFVIKNPDNPDSYWGAFAGEKSGTIKFILKKNKDIKAAAEQITAGATSDDEKLRKLYDFCQKEIKNQFYNASITAEQRRKLPAIKNMVDVLKRKEASVPGYVDWLFGALAGSLGMDVRLAYTGNRSQIFFSPRMTNDRLLHLSAIAVKSGTNYRFFNPGDPFLPYGMMPWHDEESMAILIGPEDYLWKDTPVTPHSQSAHKRTAALTLKEDGTLEGDVTVEITGQPALSYRQANYDETPEKHSEFLRDAIKARISSAEVTNMSVENVLDHTKPLIQRYRVSIPNYAQKTGKRLFVQPGFFEYGPSPVFSGSERKYGVFFPYPWSETDKIEIKLPAGFTLDSADKPAPISDPQKIGQLKIDISVDQKANVLFYDRNFYFGNDARLLFPVGSYQALKNLFDAFHQSDIHTITLKQQ